LQTAFRQLVLIPCNGTPRNRQLLKEFTKLHDQLYRANGGQVFSDNRLPTAQNKYMKRELTASEMTAFSATYFRVFKPISGSCLAHFSSVFVKIAHEKNAHAIGNQN
jgi:hypothetical protein